MIFVLWLKLNGIAYHLFLRYMKLIRGGNIQRRKQSHSLFFITRFVIGKKNIFLKPVCWHWLILIRQNEINWWNEFLWVNYIVVFIKTTFDRFLSYFINWLNQTTIFLTNLLSDIRYCQQPIILFKEVKLYQTVAYECRDLKWSVG